MHPDFDKCLIHFHTYPFQTEGIIFSPQYPVACKVIKQSCSQQFYEYYHFQIKMYLCRITKEMVSLYYILSTNQSLPEHNNLRQSLTSNCSERWL
jgi:hypothetical protein